MLNFAKCPLTNGQRMQKAKRLGLLINQMVVFVLVEKITALI